MRPISTAHQAVYAAAVNARGVFVKVEIDRTGSGGWVDLTNLNGFDWVQSVDYGSSVDAVNADANVQLHRNFEDLSLSPFMTNSLLNGGGTLLQAGRDIRISTATMPLDTPPSAGDFTVVLTGTLDRVSLGDTITLRCRDQGGLLQDRFIETIKEYGDDGGSKQVEDVMQDILDDVFGASVIDLYSVNGTGGTPWNAGDSPGWAIRKYEQQRQPVMDALKVLSNQIGYDLRYRYQQNTGDIQLVMQQPDRAASTALRTFAVDEYIIQSLEQSRENVRNVVRVVYTDSAGRRQSTDLAAGTDAASVAKYGRRYMEIAEEASSQIDTSTEANKLRDGALNDLKEPNALVNATVPYFMEAELGDYYQLDADGVYFDTANKFGLLGLRHRMSGGEGWTTFQLEGQPKSQKKRWVASNASFPTKKFSWRNVANRGATMGNLLNNGVFNVFTRD
jgi:hypothetical protein